MSTETLEPTAAATTDPQNAVVANGSAKVTSIELEGFGRMAGRSLKGELIKSGKEFLIVKITDKSGNVKDQKFQTVDGQAPNAKADGFRIPKDVLTQLKGGKASGGGVVKSGKTKRETSNPSGLCFCGCGETTKSRFAQGHDAKAHSWVLQYLRGQLPQEKLASESDYVRNMVEAKGGWNSVPEPVKTRKKTSTTEGVKNEKGNMLYGSAAKAYLEKQAKKAEEAAAASNGKTEEAATAPSPA